MHKIFIGLGTNIGDLKQNIEMSIKLLSKFVDDISRADLYGSKAMYYEKQSDFLNTVVSGETKIEPMELLKRVKEIEQKMGREKTFRNGPRVIDLDILFYDDLILKTDDLIIPHLLLAERDFVLQPFCDLEPEFVHPELGVTMRALLGKIPLEVRSIEKV